VEAALKPQAEATVPEAGRKLPMALEQETDEGTKRGIGALLGSLVGIALV
jgi:hypothetical protein